MAIFKEWSGNLLDCPADVITNTVNCVGAWRAGLNKQFGTRWPDLVNNHYKKCKAGKIQPGILWLWKITDPGDTRRVLMFPTKRDWRDKSDLDDIILGLRKLALMYKAKNISQIALPPLGCGLGGLDYKAVAETVHCILEPTELKVFMIVPGNASSKLRRYWR